ncbi:MAG: hypothetical protein CL927_04605 [Deltaproteobacteria bacterium]|nr:hypothetical protein [Deltaproteobacteria bacterium]
MFRRGPDLVLAALVGLGLAAPQGAMAQEQVREAGNIGVGVGGNILGVGVSGKYFINEANAVQALVGMGSGGGTLLVSADYLYNFDPFIKQEEISVGWYAGFGGGLILGSSVLGVAGVVGSDFDLDELPLDIFFEYRPTLFVSPAGAAFRADSFAAGLRYYF